MLRLVWERRREDLTAYGQCGFLLNVESGMIPIVPLVVYSSSSSVLVRILPFEDGLFFSSSDVGEHRRVLGDQFCGGGDVEADLSE